MKIKTRQTGEPERIVHKTGQDNGAEVAAPIWGERLFTAGIGRLYLLTLAQVIVPVHVVDEQDPGFGKVIR